MFLLILICLLLSLPHRFGSQRFAFTLGSALCESPPQRRFAHHHRDDDTVSVIDMSTRTIVDT